MNFNLLRPLYLAASLSLFASTAPSLAQTTAAPGASPDGAPPAAGAIQGGSIDEAKKPAKPRSSIEGSSSEHRSVTPSPAEKCRELSKTLEQQCLKDLRERRTRGNESDAQPAPRDAPASSAD